MRKKAKKLSREEKKIVWAGPKENLGCGWQSKYKDKPVNPIAYEDGRYP